MASGFPFDEKIVFTVSVFLFILLSVIYFQETDFAISYTSAIGATLSVLMLYLMYKLHTLENMPHTVITSVPRAASSKKRRRR
ncbi:hypothetical protein KJ765_05200 [Candidatus Micrarchaeota archaeon]|nr:hypothetical protein [Candidatus Micrarchaeota archaeon]